jgi:hypothetical protein
MPELYDDGANYPGRYALLQSGGIDAAVFTVDAYLSTAAKFAEKNPDATLDQKLPGTIALVIDETKGADALAGYKAKYPNIDSLNKPDTKFVLTPNSPSEALSRVVFGYFNLNRVDRNKCFVHTKSSTEVYEIARKAKPDASQVYGVWEPDLSKLLQNPNIHVIVDSSRFRGYIVDVLLFNRNFLIENHQTAKDVIVAYLRTQYERRNMLPQAVKSDALLASNLSLSDQQANRTVQGIWWKNTSENYGHLGVTTDSSLQNIENIIRQNADILIKSGAIDSDPSEGQPNYLYYPKILQELKDEGFHPGVSTDSAEETVRAEKILPELNEDQWNALHKIGTLKIDELVFARGSSELTENAKGNLNKLAESLRAWPTYYVTIQGNSADDRELALERARTAEAYLVDKGIERSRVRALAGKPTGATRVTFTLGQQSY